MGVTYGGQGQPMDVDRQRAQQTAARACYNCGGADHFVWYCPHPQAPRVQRLRRMVEEITEEEKSELRGF
ncbi:hypothetical protein PAXRUDRAFT_829165 [Paxillus rubicundulus Ve08.2h10]|uniref:CCHC-type domain-containing protein n=1 Tax=Paxillus rubicundulus Ve08.2h10 TaxID=930991 RepID=A0A0D0DV36_9AGAM|nr:hypothetical protein PAXRUDRAFT_829165 [Paxillus rubicundulus Ve08.2h10]